MRPASLLNLKLGLTLPLVVFSPVLFFAHGVVWTKLGYSSATLIYGNKLVGLFIIAAVVGNYGTKIFLRETSEVLGIATLLVTLGCLAPFAYEDKINWFYYTADAVGLIATFLYFFCIFFLLVKRIISVDYLYRLLTLHMAVICGAIVCNYILSAGEKVSIPPEIHYPLAVYLVGALLGRRKSSRLGLITTAVVLTGIIMAQFRINLLIVLSGIILVVTRRFFLGHWRLNLRKLFPIISVALLLSVSFSEKLIDRIQSIALVSAEEASFQTPFSDASANQRFAEADLVLKELSRQPFYVYLIGKGSGAEYSNDNGAIPHYPERQHHVHMTPLVVLLRSGILGLCIYLLPLLLAIYTAFNRNVDLFIASAGVILTYLALMTDQYLYWSPTYGISLAVWLYVWRSTCGQRVGSTEFGY